MRFDKQRDRAHGIDRRHVDHARCAGFQVDGAVNVQPLPAAGLFNRDFGVLRRPTAGRPRLVRRMHGIGEQHGFIIAESVEQIFVSRDESLLLRRIKLARQHPGLAIFQVQPRQQLDQGRAGVADAIDCARSIPPLGCWSAAASAPPSLSTPPAAIAVNSQARPL